MMTQSQDRLQYRHQRKYHRYELCCPVHIEFPIGESVATIEAFSRNVSVGGMLVETETTIPKHAPVSLSMTIDQAPVVRPVRLAAEGRVVRVVSKNSGYAIAIECSRPFMQMEKSLASQ